MSRPLEIVGDAAALCEDGVCEIPEADDNGVDS
jgi:hypothetical protein